MTRPCRAGTRRRGASRSYRSSARRPRASDEKARSVVKTQAFRRIDPSACPSGGAPTNPAAPAPPPGRGLRRAQPIETREDRRESADEAPGGEREGKRDGREDQGARRRSGSIGRIATMAAGWPDLERLVAHGLTPPVREPVKDAARSRRTVQLPRACVSGFAPPSELQKPAAYSGSLHRCTSLSRGASPLGLPDTRSRAPLATARFRLR